MRWKTFSIAAAAMLAAAALPLAAQAGTNQPQRNAHARLLHRVVRLDRRVIRLDRRTIRTDRRVIRAIRNRTGKANGVWLAGSVGSATSTSVTLNVLWTGKNDSRLDGQTVNVAIDASTKIVYGKGQSSIDQGDLIRVTAVAADSTLGSLTARRIHVDCNCHYAFGTLGSIGSGSFAVNVSRTGPYDTVLKGNAVTFQVNGSTTFVQGKAETAGALSDLEPGQKVGVIFAASGFFRDPRFNWQTATFTATRVHRWDNP
jgi:hypothetical protein